MPVPAPGLSAMSTKLTFIIFLVGIAYAAQTRIKIGSQSWGYQIELNRGQNVRTEFADEEGVASGVYTYKVGNETKKLEYRIDPNRMEPDISFNVLNVETPAAPTTPAASMNEVEGVLTTTMEPSTTNTNSTSNSTEATTSPSISSSKMTFDSIDSKQDFKGHVTLKVGNSTYTISFVTGDKSHTREETLQPNGMMLGRFTYLLKNSPTKLVINYKFNSTSPDPTFEVSLYKTIESDSSSSSSSSNGNSNYPPVSTPRENYSRQVSYPARNIADRYNSIHPSVGSSQPGTPIRSPHYPLPEKYRDRSSPPSSSSPQVVPPSWYNQYSRGKPVYDP